MGSEMCIRDSYIEDNDILCPMKALNKISLLIMVMAGLLTEGEEEAYVVFVG